MADEELVAAQPVTRSLWRNWAAFVAKHGDKLLERRFKSFTIARDQFVRLLLGEIRLTEGWLPRGTTIESFCGNHDEADLMVVVSHPSFEIIKDGEIIPTLGKAWFSPVENPARCLVETPKSWRQEPPLL